MHKYSIIIPTLNEEKVIEKVIAHLNSFKDDIEIIIADGRSEDKTTKIAEKYKVKVVQSSPGKGIQINEGLKNSTGEILVVLHADTLLPNNTFSLIEEAFLNDQIKIATFKLKFDYDHFILKFYSYFTRFDSVFTTFGDQVIIIRKAFLNKLGGFPDLPIFEDVELFRKARRHAKIFKLPATAETSSRRFMKKGIIKTQLLNAWYIFHYLKRTDSQKIHKKYFKSN